MKNSIYLLSIIFFLGVGCQQVNQERISILQNQIDILQTKNQDLKKENSGNLVHIVYLDLKENLSEQDKESVEELLKNLAVISEVKNLEVGDFKDLGDKRALSKYETILKMNFKDEAAYKIYQAHPIHLNLKKVLVKYLASPPATYDYIIVPKE